LWNTVRSYIRATATANFDITVEQFHVLRYVRRGKDSMGELATAKNISRPAISQAVDVLVHKGLLTRIQSTKDRRYVDVALTDAGNHLLDTVFKETRIWMKGRMSKLTASELETISKAMEVMKKMLE
jgi:DNA-binding MarR family transcriptional regulator